MSSEQKREPEEDGSTPTILRRRIDDVLNKPMCLVVEHKAKNPAAHSILLDIGAMAPLHLSQRGMSFAAVESPHGSWIVGVGGADHLHAVIYDVRASQEWQGPFLDTVRMEPVLIPLRGC